MRPERRFIIPGATAATTQIDPFRLISIMSSIFWAGVWPSGVGNHTPAELMTISIGPISDATFLTSNSTSRPVEHQRRTVGRRCRELLGNPRRANDLHHHLRGGSARLRSGPARHRRHRQRAHGDPRPPGQRPQGSLRDAVRAAARQSCAAIGSARDRQRAISCFLAR